ncbi:fungal-specific transcription factor domain-containing protein [Nemania sp. FL0916]|nr:fungal-specific transcription factor domain-containing protein [Nemania sp. FL0916]
MSGSRTKTGCYSCRIRRKKCDEAKPHCLACSSRGIDCLGYDAKPAWMAGLGSWQEILESEEAKAIRKSAGTAYKLRRSRQRRVIEKTSQETRDGLPSGEFDENPSMAMDTLWWDSNMASVNGSPTFNFRSVMHFLEVICPLQFGFSSLQYHPDYQDHRWLINTLIEDEPLYHASRGLSLCLESGREDGNTSGFCNASADVRKMQVMAIRGLQLRVNDLAIKRQHCVTPPVDMISSVLATIMQLLSLEIFNSLGGDWKVHLQAANITLGLFQKPWLSRRPGLPAARPESDPVRALLCNPKDTDASKSLEFFITAFVWVDIIASASIGEVSTNATDFEYATLLLERLIDPCKIMGCHSAVMTAIYNINALDAWREILHKEANSDWAQFLESASAIELAIEGCLGEVINSRAYPSPGSADIDSKVVTAIFGHAALIYLHLVTSEDAVPTRNMSEEIQRCLEKLEILPARLFIRVCWPFAVAGCMAEEKDHERFKALVARVIAERQVLGLTWKALIIMEECWRLRRNYGGKWCWRTTMKQIGLRVLFI